jgi:hypothetical protein
MGRTQWPKVGQVPRSSAGDLQRFFVLFALFALVALFAPFEPVAPAAAPPPCSLKARQHAGQRHFGAWSVGVLVRRQPKVELINV